MLCLSTPVLFMQANIGQEEDFEAAREKALKLGAKKVSSLNILKYI